ncbi:thiol:disulfide interchange protein DsbA/DsbL [Neisseriaceae bacterium ESL0693]|nr:thiol:disulfide interchange protein DsbA/DsbL [Neisseriaceae bacterium ESL0693]
MFKKTIALLAATLTLTCGLAQAAVENVDYDVLKTPIPQLQKDKVEVLEFFSYSCIHCYDLDPYLLKAAKNFAPDTYLRPVHVVWDDDIYFKLARIAAAVNSTHMKFEADPLIFNAIFKQQIDLSKPDVFKSWASQQTAFDGNKLVKAYDSMNNVAEANQMKELGTKYNIVETPVVIVGGKYRMLFPNGHQAGMKTLDELINKVRQERSLKPADKHPAAKAIGAALAASANH